MELLLHNYNFQFSFYQSHYFSKLTLWLLHYFFPTSMDFCHSHLISPTFIVISRPCMLVFSIESSLGTASRLFFLKYMYWTNTIHLRLQYARLVFLSSSPKTKIPSNFQSWNADISVLRDPAWFSSPHCCGIMGERFAWLERNMQTTSR